MGAVRCTAAAAVMSAGLQLASRSAQGAFAVPLQARHATSGRFAAPRSLPFGNNASASHEASSSWACGTAAVMLGVVAGALRRRPFVAGSMLGRRLRIQDVGSSCFMRRACSSTTARNAAPQSDISQVDLRVGQIVSCERHPDSEKLLVEKIDLGEEGGPRTICSGIAAWFSPEEVIGRKCVVVANLKARKIGGIESNGMLLCAKGTSVVAAAVPAAGGTTTDDSAASVSSAERDLAIGERDWKAEAELSKTAASAADAAAPTVAAPVAAVVGGESLAIIEAPADAKIGERVVIEITGEAHGDPAPPNKVEKKKLFVKVAPHLGTDADGTVRFKESPFMTSGGAVTAKSIPNGVVS